MKDNKFFRKAISVVMMLSLLLPIASCSKQNSDDERRVSKNMPWFTSATYDICPIVFSISLTSLSPVSYKNLCSIMYG